jgi:hypothetical protein
LEGVYNGICTTNSQQQSFIKLLLLARENDDNFITIPDLDIHVYIYQMIVVLKYTSIIPFLQYNYKSGKKRIGYIYNNPNFDVYKDTIRSIDPTIRSSNLYTQSEKYFPEYREHQDSIKETREELKPLYEQQSKLSAIQRTIGQHEGFLASFIKTMKSNANDRMS